MIELTEESKRVFVQYIEDASNWSGTPLVGGNCGGSKSERGNLTDLKKKGLVRTFSDKYQPSEIWIEFTEKGKAFAASLGYEWNGAGFNWQRE